MNINKIKQKIKDWSLRLALAFDDQDWDEVSAACSEINHAYCDLAYGKEPKREQLQEALESAWEDFYEAGICGDRLQQMPGFPELRDAIAKMVEHG